MITEFEWQDHQGCCPRCGFEFLLPAWKNLNYNLKYCIGFIEPTFGYLGEPYVPKKDSSGIDMLVLGFECPKCFTKSGCHVHKSWKERYSIWIK